MAAETITVYIDPHQLLAQKNNKYNLFLAKMVNGTYTVIWQSMGPIATVNQPAYEYLNTFNIQVPSYEVNYGTVTTSTGVVTFSAGGLAQDIDIGQKVDLDQNGLFGTPTNGGTSGEITIVNNLAANPHAILLDNAGNPIYVNTESGMDIGTTTLTPIDTYQVWFDNYQATGTIISRNVSQVGTVTFSGGTTNQVISYNASGEWESGPLGQPVALAAGRGEEDDVVIVSVLATFKYALTVAAATYLLNKLIDKFSGGLRPTKIQTSVGSAKLTVQFSGSKSRQILQSFGTDKFEAALNQALSAAKKDPSSGLQSETWTLSEAAISVSC